MMQTRVPWPATLLPALFPCSRCRFGHNDRGDWGCNRDSRCGSRRLSLLPAALPGLAQPGDHLRPLATAWTVEKAFEESDRVKTFSFHRHGNQVPGETDERFGSFFPATSPTSQEQVPCPARNVPLKDGIDDSSNTHACKPSTFPSRSLSSSSQHDVRHAAIPTLHPHSQTQQPQEQPTATTRCPRTHTRAA
ncbi:hypothetical protein BCR44DRAFT_44251, partial [Catenaria anguillulae PL171]